MSFFIVSRYLIFVARFMLFVKDETFDSILLAGVFSINLKKALSDEYKIQSARDVLETKLVKRGVALKALEYGKIESALGGTARQKITLQSGIPTDKAREIVKMVKATKRKVQVSIQGDQVRVTGKKKDDLQSIIGLLKESDLGIAMQFTNYR